MMPGLTGLSASVRLADRGARAWAWPLEIASSVRLRWREPDAPLRNGEAGAASARSLRRDFVLPLAAASHSPRDQPHAHGARAAGAPDASRPVTLALTLASNTGPARVEPADSESKRSTRFRKGSNAPRRRSVLGSKRAGLARREGTKRKRMEAPEAPSTPARRDPPPRRPVRRRCRRRDPRRRLFMSLGLTERPDDRRREIRADAGRGCPRPATWRRVTDVPPHGHVSG